MQCGRGFSWVITKHLNEICHLELKKVNEMCVETEHEYELSFYLFQAKRRKKNCTNKIQPASPMQANLSLLEFCFVGCLYKLGETRPYEHPLMLPPHSRDHFLWSEKKYTMFYWF